MAALRMHWMCTTLRVSVPSSQKPHWENMCHIRCTLTSSRTLLMRCTQANIAASSTWKPWSPVKKMLCPTVCSVSFQIYNESWLMSLSSDTQGHYMIGKEQIDNVMDRVQHLADNCTALPSSPLPTNMDTNLTCPQQGHEKLQHCDSAVCCMSAHIAGLGGIYRSREMCMTWRVLPVAATLTMLVFGTLFLINKD